MHCMCCTGSPVMFAASVNKVQPAFDVGAEFVKDIDARVDQDRVRSRDEDRRCVMVLVRPPQARDRGRAVVAQEFTIGGHHTSAVVMTPDGMQKCVAQASLVRRPGGAEIACILMIERLHGKKNAAL